MSNCFKNVSFWKQSLAVLAASLGMLNWGNMIGWTNVASPQLRGNETGFEMEDDGSSWVGSTIAFGAMFGSIFAGKLMDLIGRKKLLIAANVLSLVGWTVIVCASSVIVVCVGRFLGGVAVAAITVTAAVYVGEMVNSNLRGSFGSFLAFSECLGLQYVLAIGELTQDWRITTVTCMAPPVLGIFLLLLVPESPYYLAWKSGNLDDARPGVNWILNNNKDEVEKFIMDIEDYLKSMNGNAENVEETMFQPKNLGLKDEGQQKVENITLATNLGSIGKEEHPVKMVTTNDLEKQEDEVTSEKGKKFTMFDVKMILIGSTALMFSKITGIPVLDFYMVEIFDASALTVSPAMSAIIVRTAEMISTAIALYTTDKVGRKLLLILSGLGMALGMGILGISFSLMDEDSRVPYMWVEYLPLLGAVIFYLAYTVGFNSVILVLIGELYSPSIKGVATSILTVVWWVSEFITAKLYFICNSHLGMDGTFYMLAGISVLSAIFVQIFIRESRNKTLAEIQDLYKEKRKFCKL